jgi:hypothetical protein
VFHHETAAATAQGFLYFIHFTVSCIFVFKHLLFLPGPAENSCQEETTLSKNIIAKKFQLI